VAEEIEKKRSGPVKGETIQRAITTTLEDLYNGKVRKLKITRNRLCKNCKGSGSSDPNMVSNCNKCDGKGVVNKVQKLSIGFIQQVRTTCEDCNGQGKVIQEKYKCKNCNGKKVLAEEKTLEISVEKGMKNGQMIKFEGESDEKPGVIAGDIVFIIQEQQHQVFKRQNNNLIIEKKINLSEALTGFSFKLETLDKRVLLIRSRKGQVIKPGSCLKITGEGMPSYKSSLDKGDLLIYFEIEFPKKIPDKLSEKIRKNFTSKNKNGSKR